MKQRIVLLGAFDRYNYGDNLLPILFEMYIRKYAGSVLERYDLWYCAITGSDLSRYGARPTTSLGDAVLDETVHSIIAVGGETLAATSSALILHNSPAPATAAAVRLLRSVGLKPVADMLCRCLLKLPWEFPYIPEKVAPQTKVALNTVGGTLPAGLMARTQRQLAERLRGADYISARDRRTAASIRASAPATLYPDSAVTMGALVTDNHLARHVGAEVRAQLSRQYICFQAAPAKVGCTIRECAETLREIVSASGFELVLLPIGYASGHDDRQFLSRLQEDPGLRSILLPDLNIWEIMALIRNSRAFVGTSLHGCTTAMSFGVPHVALNPEVTKLQSFMQDWALAPFDRCFRVDEMPGAVDAALHMDRSRLRAHADYLQALGLENYSELLAAIGLPDGDGESARTVSGAGSRPG